MANADGNFRIGLPAASEVSIGWLHVSPGELDMAKAGASDLEGVELNDLRDQIFGAMCSDLTEAIRLVVGNIIDLPGLSERCQLA